MQELRLKKYSDVATLNEEETQKVKQMNFDLTKELNELQTKFYNLERALKVEQSDKQLQQKRFKLEIKEYDNTKGMVYDLK